MTKLLLQCKEPEVHAHEEATGSDDENHTTDQLTRLLQNAKVNAKEDLEHRLKRPSSAVSERLPLGEIGTNRFH